MQNGWREQYIRYRGYFLNIQSLYKQRADIRAFLEIILSISTVIIFLAFALKPTALTIISLYGQIQEKQVTVAGLDQKLNDLQTANGIFTSNQNFISDVDTSIATLPQPDILSEQIQGVAAKDGVTLLGISISQVAVAGNGQNIKTSSGLASLPDGAHEMPVTINAKGSYSNLVAFIKDMENLRTVVRLDTLGINSSQTNAGNVTVVAISGRVPYLGQ